MKNIYYLLILCLLPVFSLAQKSYNSVALNSSYQMPVYSKFAFTKNEYRRVFVNGISSEKYFKSGVKLSLGVNFVYGNYKYTGNYIDSNFNTIGNYSRQTQAYVLEIPFTIAYNIMPKTKKLHVFMMAGYSLNRQFFYRTKYYNSQLPADEMVYTKKSNYHFGNISTGIEARYIIKDKYFMGLSLAFNEMVHPNGPRFLNDIHGSAVIKAGILF